MQKFKQKYDLIFITELPVFYKINLYNRLSEDLNIYVIFLASGTLEQRGSDFICAEIKDFDYIILNKFDLQNRKAIVNFFKIKKILNQLSYEKVIFCAWNYLETWLLCLIQCQIKNAFVLESTYYESKLTGWKSILKRFFLKRISTVFASGKYQVKLLEALNYQGKIVKTNGVGIINKSPAKIKLGRYLGRYIFIGRLIKKKNIELLISVFNDLPHLKLTIVGEGPLLKKICLTTNSNIKILGSINNSDLPNILTQHDLLLLPRYIEPWGLVAEEALYYGLPAIISEPCGVRSILQENIHYLSFDPRNQEELKSLLREMSNDLYTKMCANAGPCIINKKDNAQLEAYHLGKK